MYETKEELQKKVDEYFYNSEYDEDGKRRDRQLPVTITGLAFFLGFKDRQSIIDYRKRPEFSEVLQVAKLRIEKYLEECLYGQSVTGVIFNLKNNFGWKDKSEFEHSGPDGGPIENKIEWTIQPVKPIDET